MQQYLVDAANEREKKVVEALLDDDWQVRVAAATELETIGAGGTVAIPVLIRMLEADSVHWIERQAAADALGAVTGLDLPDAAAWQRWWEAELA